MRNNSLIAHMVRLRSPRAIIHSQPLARPERAKRVEGYERILQSNNGHILLELVIAIALLTFIAGLSFQYTNLHKTAIVQADLEKLYSLMIFLQREAYLKNKIIKLSFNKNKKLYSTENISGQLSDNVNFGIIKDIKGPPANPESIILDPISFNNHVILFYQNGTISSGTIYLTDKDKTILYALTCGVSYVAYIRKYKYKHKWQLL